MSRNFWHPIETAFRDEIVTIFPGNRHHTKTPDTNSHPMDTQHKLRQIVSPLAKSLLALNVPAALRRPISTIRAPLVESCTPLVGFPKK